MKSEAHAGLDYLTGYERWRSQAAAELDVVAGRSLT
jgi:hypothetical protein